MRTGELIRRVLGIALVFVMLGGMFGWLPLSVRQIEASPYGMKGDDASDILMASFESSGSPILGLQLEAPWTVSTGESFYAWGSVIGEGGAVVAISGLAITVTIKEVINGVVGPTVVSTEVYTLEGRFEAGPFTLTEAGEYLMSAVCVHMGVIYGADRPLTVIWGAPPSYAPIARASDIKDQPNLMLPNTPYTVTAKYVDPDGREDLKYCYLQLKHPSRDLTMMWVQAIDEFWMYAGEGGDNYLTAVSGDVTPITEVGLEGYEIVWRFTINDQWPAVENAIDFGVYAWDDGDLKSGWRYDDTKASFRLTPITKPIAFTVEKSDLFYVKLRLQNDDPDNSYDVSFRVVDANGDIAHNRYYAYIWPGFAKTSENSLKIQAGRQASVTLVFDPQVTADLQLLSEMGIELSYLVQSEHVHELVAVSFEGYTAVTATGFDMTKDAYSFANWEFTPGKCYGMATTSVHYFTGELSLPTHRENTFSLTIDEAEPHIDNYQNSTLNKLLATWTKLSDNTLTASEYGELITILGNEREPMLVILDGAEDKKSDGHAMVIYGVVETPDSAYMLIYDNNYPFSWLDVGPLPYMQYDFASKELEYETYTNFKVARAHEKWYDWIKAGVFSPAELRVYDSEGRMTGVIDGEVQEEMPWSLFDHEDNSVVILRQPDTYSYEVVGTDNDSYGLSVDYLGTEQTMTFTAIDIPTSPSAIHRYHIDWDAVARGDEGVTVEVDSDGDGEFERTFTAGSELTGDQFILHTETFIDFDPDVLNLRARGGVVTAYIELPTGFDVHDIDISTILLNGTVPALSRPTAIGDYNRNGIPDLMVKFDRRAVQAILEVGQSVEITITGEVDGIPFMGTDTIRVIGR